MKQKFYAALYIRLSREDGDGTDSNSVINQRALLTSYAENIPEIINFREFVDDGYTGTDFNRPAFEALMQEVEEGSINCVIVKDLSRLGRNYIELGRLTEIVFPQKKVRFIAINDGIDSYRTGETASSIIVPFKNLLNDEYSRDISVKIRSALDTRRKSGAFIGAFASYGYKKDPSNHGKIIIDPEPAEIVQRIFRLYTEGIGKHTIARMLNAEGVLSPAAYKRKTNPTYHPPNGSEASLWSFSSVDRILKNRIYTGEMVQGKTKMLSHRIHTPIKQEEDNWIIVSNTHEAIISKETFQSAASIGQVKTRADQGGSTHVLSGLVRCGSCGRSLNRRTITQTYGTYHYYFCPTYRQAKDACTKHSVRVELVEHAVLGALRQEISRAADLSALHEKYKNRTIASSCVNRQTALKKEIEKLNTLKKSVYEDWKMGDLTREEYLDYKTDYIHKIETLTIQLENLKQQPEKINPWILRLSELENLTELNRELVISLIDEITVYSETHIRILFKFHDALAEMESAAAQYAT